MQRLEDVKQSVSEYVSKIDIQDVKRRVLLGADIFAHDWGLFPDQDRVRMHINMKADGDRSKTILTGARAGEEVQLDVESNYPVIEGGIYPIMYAFLIMVLIFLVMSFFKRDTDEEDDYKEK